tara:strand:- start:734 stop:1108 length:375 start_codon:yes stop_codon:yes gene_type:complete
LSIIIKNILSIKPLERIILLGIITVPIKKNYYSTFNLMTANKKKKFNGEGKQLSHQVSKSMRTYFKQLDGEAPNDVYNMVLKEVESSLLEIVMQQCNDNQTKASEMLGINRGTLRTKLKAHNLI